MKIDRYQGYIKNGQGAINDHQNSECIIRFNRINRKVSEKLLKACLDILNEENMEI